MKTKLTLCGIICAIALIAWAESPNVFQKNVQDTTIPELLGTNISARTFVFIGLKTERTTNTSQVWLQMNNPTNNAVGAIPLQPGQIISVTVDMQRARVVNWWIDVETVGDGVICQIIQ